MLLGVVRHLLTIAGTVLVTRGTLDEAQATQGVGAICTLLAIVWSMQAKRSGSSGPGTGVVVSVMVALLGVILLGTGCASPARVVTADIRLQCGTNVVTVTQPKDTVIDSLEFEPATGRLILHGYQSTASAAAVEATRAQAAVQGQVINASLGVIESLAARLAQSQGVPMAASSPQVSPVPVSGTNTTNTITSQRTQPHAR